MIPPLSEDTGHLPVGRHRCTVEDVRLAFCEDQRYAASSSRALIWQQWLQATDVLRTAIEVCAAWLGGSFTSSKVDPNDIDVLYFIHERNIRKARSDSRAASIVSLFMGSGLLQQRGVPVDAYIVAWRPNPHVAPRDTSDHQYYMQRGYWDDFWQRLRTGTPGAAPTQEDAVPRRGYLEVMLDGFTV